MDYSVDDLFRIKQKFLMQIPHPKVFLKYINDLGEKKIIFEDIVLLAKSKQTNQNLYNSIQNFLSLEGNLKLAVANAPNSSELQKALVDYLNELLIVMVSFALKDKGFEKPSEFKISQPIPFYEISKTLAEIDNVEVILESKEESLSYSKENPKFAVLLENILRAKLIIDG